MQKTEAEKREIGGKRFILTLLIIFVCSKECGDKTKSVTYCHNTFCPTFVHDTSKNDATKTWFHNESVHDAGAKERKK